MGAGIGGLVAASDEAALNVAEVGGAPEVTVGVPAAADLTIEISQGDAILLAAPLAVGPDHFARLRYEGARTPNLAITVRVLGENGRVVLSYVF